MSIVELAELARGPSAADAYRLAQRRKKMKMNHARVRARQAAAFVEAGVDKIREENYDDPEFLRALALVAHAVKDKLSPQGLAFLEGTLLDDDRAGRVRWRELARLDLWLARASLPVGGNARRLAPPTKFTASNDNRLSFFVHHPFKLHAMNARLTGRLCAAVYRIAKRAQVSPTTVLAAAVQFGLTHIAQSIRAAKQVPPAITQEMNDRFPVHEE